MLVLELLISILSVVTSEVVEPITIGLFPSENSIEQRAFELAVHKVNLDPNLYDVKLQAQIKTIDMNDVYNAGKTVCNTLENGVGAFFGAAGFESSNIIQSICDKIEIPRIEFRWEMTPKKQPNYYINLFPEPMLLSRGYTAIVKDMDWTSFTLIYQRKNGLQRLQHLIQDFSGISKISDPESAALVIIQLPENDDFRPLLKNVKKSLEGHIVLDCDTDIILKVLKQAEDVGLLDEYHTFIITSPDAHTVDYSNINFKRTNITTVRLINPTTPTVNDVVSDLSFVRQRMGLDIEELNAHTTTVNALILYDAVNIFAKAVHGLGGTNKIISEPKNCSDHNSTGWSNGYALINYMRVIEAEGLSGVMRFDSQSGQRNYFTLEMVELTKTGFKKIGVWDPENGMTYTRTRSQMLHDLVQANMNKTFIVVSKITEPYMMLKDDHKDRVGNDKYQGYVVDLIEMIAREINITYEFRLRNDGNGKKDKKTGKWSGLIGEVQELRADLAVCDLTITHERRTAVDFTTPFMNLGISILFSKPKEPETNLFSFTQPLSFHVWIYTATAYLSLSIILYLLARIAPKEWQNPHPCATEPEQLENSLSLINCLWFSLGSILCQGSDILPRAFSTRVCAAMWWFFALIVTQSYTANWTAFLTSSRKESPIKRVEDLDKQSAIKYGCVLGQSTAGFFENSNVNLYKKMWSVMETYGDTVMMSDNNQGVDRVKKEREAYAFFMESSTIEYEVKRNCDLTEVGSWLDNKAYGIALPFNAPHRTAFSMAVLKLSESGKLMELKNKWWTMGDGQTCPEQQEDSTELDVSEVGGMFVILVLGCFIAFLFSILEFLWNIRKVAVEEKLSPWDAFICELKFVFKFHQSIKPVRHTEGNNEAN
ncbi:glutamate receptor ionotropic, kainate 2-like isoform X2 [Daktulosphaira vitifoliae]|uniref:glutamate receptor ionotropic, kainate 2-like isoform X2 n=1 Tax=Daktulosphaira vitifoliae TaxID=58002 RepID=UPI0021AA7DCD|nr:glutamate receptor ionotropic, kainate 2-like isoform X2 [Daktulosphaira vitifoliae]